MAGKFVYANCVHVVIFNKFIHDLGNHKLMCPKIYRINSDDGSNKQQQQIFETSYSREFKQFQPMPLIDSRPPYKYVERHYTPDTLMTNYQ